MADVIVADGDPRHNRSSNSSSSADLQLSKHLFELTEDFIHGLGQICTLCAVAKDGLFSCTETTQQQYINMIHEIAEGAMLSFMEIVAVYRDKDEKEEL